MSVEIRKITVYDTAGVAALAVDSDWTAENYLVLDTLVAVEDGVFFEVAFARVVGLIAARTLVEDAEHEILNVVVEPSRRGQGIGSKLLKTLLAGRRGLWFLEVREGNTAALRLYKSFGFIDFGRRKGYYQKPYEDAIVMSACS